MATTDKAFFGIRLKLFILVLIGFSLLIALTVWRIGEQAEKVAGESLQRSLSQSAIILTTQMNSRYAAIEDTAISLSRDGRILPRVFDGDALTLQDLSQEFRKALDFDILFVTDASGMILARSDRPEAIGYSMAGRSPVFDAALAGQRGRGIITSQGQLLQLVAVPVFDNVARDVVRGSIALAYALSPAMAREINTLTASDIGFYLFSRDPQRQINGVTSTYHTAPALQAILDDYFRQHPELWQQIHQQRIDNDIALDLAGEEFHAIIQPLAGSGGDPLGFVMALRSQTELLRPFMRIQQEVILVGLLCLLIAFLIAWLIARHISRPIDELVQMTQAIENGNYPEQGNSARRRDEVGLLYRALTRMGKSIREKAEMENYLAQIAEAIDDADWLMEQQSDLKLFDDTATDARPAANTGATGCDETTDIETTVIMAADPAGKTVLRERSLAVGQTLVPGTLIDQRYQIIRLLGSGAMGQVYQARDMDLNEFIALKLLNQYHFSKQELQMLKEEVRLARRITHRNILRTFDFGIWQGFYYITMEFVHGHDLARLINSKGPLDIHIGIVMARQICSAIAAAHDQGIIHRDLKPANMMINKQGILKIMDFGLAMQINQTDDSSGSKTIAGTPKYMAPEQFLGEGLDQRTDIYAVGVILFTLFTGDAPFNAPAIDELASRHFHEPPPSLRSRLPQAPEKLEQIINKSLQKNKQDRYQSINELLADLQGIS
ncbi:MAG TPA: protein kinase [Pseudomonadales bacterium]